MGLYRQAAEPEVIEATTRDGNARLEVGPNFFRLDIGDRLQLSVSESFATLLKVPRRRRKPKKRSIRLDRGARLVMARGVPTDEIGIWHEPEAGMVERLIGLRPPELLDDDAMRAWKAIDRVARRLREALAPHTHGVEDAVEVGYGLDRVLVSDMGDHLTFYVRRLFREHAKRAMEVFRDGSVVLVDKRGERKVQVDSRFNVTALGDYIRFADSTGSDLGTLSIPWISTEERRYLVDLVGQVVDQGGTARRAEAARHDGAEGSDERSDGRFGFGMSAASAAEHADGFNR